MARFLLDTSVMIDFAMASEPAYSLINTIMQSTDEVGACAVVVVEFFSGLATGDQPTWQAFPAGLE